MLCGVQMVREQTRTCEKGVDRVTAMSSPPIDIESGLDGIGLRSARAAKYLSESPGVSAGLFVKGSVYVNHQHAFRMRVRACGFKRISING